MRALCWGLLSALLFCGIVDNRCFYIKKFRVHIIYKFLEVYNSLVLPENIHHLLSATCAVFSFYCQILPMGMNGRQLKVALLMVLIW